MSFYTHTSTSLFSLSGFVSGQAMMSTQVPSSLWKLSTERLPLILISLSKWALAVARASSNSLFSLVTPSCSGYVQGTIGSADAIDKAEQHLIDLMMAFDYENQI